jgi:hypothetical protein
LQFTSTKTLVPDAGVIDTDRPVSVKAVALVEKVSVLVDESTCKTLPPPNPVAVPELTIVAPDGTVKVSPLSPSVIAVPVAGLTLFTFISDICCSLDY